MSKLTKYIEEREKELLEKFNDLLSFLEAHTDTSERENLRSFHRASLSGLLEKVREMVDQAFADERQFILNVLDGVDIADEQMQKKDGGTRAIRFNLRNRIVPTLAQLEEIK